MSIQISIPDKASDLLFWLIKNQLEGSQTPFWDDEETKLMDEILGKIGKATRRKKRLQQVRERVLVSRSSK